MLLPRDDPNGSSYLLTYLRLPKVVQCFFTQVMWSFYFPANNGSSRLISVDRNLQNNHSRGAKLRSDWLFHLE